MKDLLVGCAALCAILVCPGPACAGDPPVHLQEFPWRVGTPSDQPKRVEGESGHSQEVKVRVERIWPQDKKTHAAVTLTNTASIEFHDVVLRCNAFDAMGRQIGVQEQVLDRERQGAMKPGFVAKLEFTFDTPGIDVRALSCDADVRGMPHLAH